MKTFDPKIYLDDAEEDKPIAEVAKVKYKPDNTYDNVEQIIQKLESSGTDITSNYDDWLKVGFAFAHEFGEQGASYFHRVSKFYPEYNYKECEAQYKQCLKGRKTGVTISTFFHYAKQAGFLVEKEQEHGVLSSKRKNKTMPSEKPLPKLPDFIFEELPQLLKEVTNTGVNSNEKDILLLGALTTISSCLPNVYGIYDMFTVYPNLFLFITAPASSGKGRVNLCRRLVMPIHQQKREETNAQRVQYEVELADYYELKKKDKTLLKPNKPLEKMLFIPANSSATGTFELLANNDGSGLIFETEGDTLAQAFKSEHGNYSDGFRKAFHHESISYYRRTDSEYVDIPCPKISTVLTGTPNQVTALMPDAENGLFSRFMFYQIERQKQWRNVFASQKQEGLDTIFDKLGIEFSAFHSKFNSISQPIKIHLTNEQIRRFNDFFSKQYDKFLFLKKEGMEASLFRMGLICFRITMVLSALRMMETGNLDSIKECEPRDFEVALSMIKTLLVHTESVFLYLPKEKLALPRQKNIKERFLDELPLEFTTQGYRDISGKLKIPQKSAERYVKQFVERGYLQRKSHGNYIHISKKRL